MFSNNLWKIQNAQSAVRLPLTGAPDARTNGTVPESVSSNNGKAISHYVISSLTIEARMNSRRRSTRKCKSQRLNRKNL